MFKIMRIISGILDLDGLLAVSEAWRIARVGDLRGGTILRESLAALSHSLLIQCSSSSAKAGR